MTWEEVFDKAHLEWLMWVAPDHVHPYEPYEPRDPTTKLTFDNFVAALRLIQESGMRPPDDIYPSWDGSLCADWVEDIQVRHMLNIRDNHTFARTYTQSGDWLPFPVEL